MAYDTYCSRNSERQNTLEYAGEEQHPPPVLQLRKPRFQFPLPQALQRPNIAVRHLRPPRPLTRTLDECKQDALMPQPQDENAPMQKLRKPHPIATASEKRNSPLQQVTIHQSLAEPVISPLEEQKPSLKQPQPSTKLTQPSPDQQVSSAKQQQILLKPLQPSAIQQRLQLKQQQSSPKQQETSIKQEHPVPKQIQSSQNRQQPDSRQQSSLKPPTNENELQTDDSVSEKKSSGSTLKVKKKTPNKGRRQNNVQLRKLLMPKNAVAVLNEVLPDDLQLLKVQQISWNDPNSQNFCAEITVGDISYKGYGVSKAAARNEVAELVFRDFILKRMMKQCEADAGCEEGCQQGEGQEAGEVPMVQLASFALYKLLAAWQGAGHEVPQL